VSTTDDPRWDDHGEWDALAVGWALSALEPHDEARFAAHLPTCQRCTSTVRETLRTVSDLAYAVPDDAPPPGLKRRILLAAAAEPRQTPAADPGREPAPVLPPRRVAEAPPRHVEPHLERPVERPVEPPVEQPVERRRHAAPERGAEVVPLEPRRRRWTAVVASAAAVAVIAVLGVWNVQLRSDRDSLRGVVAQREAAISQLTADGPAKVSAVQQVDENLKPLDTRAATIVVKDGRTSIIIEALSPRVGRETYWLWTLNCDVTDLKPIEGFQVRNRGFSIQNVPSRPGLSTTQCFALSAEDKPGTPSAPGRVVAVGQLK
jgi:anti-sigma-K factor RskA